MPGGPPAIDIFDHFCRIRVFFYFLRVLHKRHQTRINSYTNRIIELSLSCAIAPHFPTKFPSLSNFCILLLFVSATKTIPEVVCSTCGSIELSIYHSLGLPRVNKFTLIVKFLHSVISYVCYINYFSDCYLGSHHLRD